MKISLTYEEISKFLKTEFKIGKIEITRSDIARAGIDVTVRIGILQGSATIYVWRFDDRKIHLAYTNESLGVSDIISKFIGESKILEKVEGFKAATLDLAKIEGVSEILERAELGDIWTGDEGITIQINIK